MKQYRIPKKKGAFPFLYCELSEEEKAVYALTPLKHPDSTRSQLDIIMAWRQFISNALGGKFRESNIPCWGGHYDQFGVVMLYLMERATEFKAGCLKDERFNGVDYHMPTLFNPSNPGDTLDRLYYRAWLSLIGHPDFTYLPIINDRHYSPLICNLHWLMGIAIDAKNKT